MIDLTVKALTLSGGLFLGMLLCLELGRRLKPRHDTEESASVGLVDSAVFALLGLLIAFTFSGAANRFEERRHLITEEVNAIGTAYLRLDLLPETSQPPLRTLFQRYVHSRITYSRQASHAVDEAHLQLALELQKLQNQIWHQALQATSRPDASNQAGMLLIPALNDMFDIATTREVSTQNHPHQAIYLLLMLIALASSVLVGYGMATSASRSWLHSLSFAFAIALSVYVILELEFPRQGLITIKNADTAFLALEKSLSAQ